jgi:hypothetical protein
MANRYTNDYGGNDSGNNSGNDFDNEDNDTLTLARNTAIETTLVDAFQFEKSWGATLGVNLGDVELLDGILMQKREDETKLKLFSWEEFGFERDEDGVAQVDDDKIPNNHMIKVGENTHNYDMLDYAIEGAEGSAGESALVGDVTIMMNKSSKARTLAELILEAGEGATGDGDAWGDDHGWLRDDVADLRDELEGRTVELFYRRISYENDDGDSKSYDQATLIDSKTGNVIREPGNDEEDEEPGGEVGGTSGETDADFPEAGQPVLDIFLNNADTDGVPNEGEVENMLDAQVEEVSQSDVDYVINQVEEEVNGKVAA